MQDSHGEKTIAALYANWYTDVLLRKVSNGHICYSPIQTAFVTLNVEGQIPFCAEEFSDVNGMKHFYFHKLNAFFKFQNSELWPN